MVLTTHAAFDTARITEGWTGAVFSRMDYGVAIFFVLSGFLLSRPFLLRSALDRPPPSTPHYLWKRMLRIMPLYWLAVAVAWAFEPGNDGIVSTSSWVANLLLLQLYQPGLLPVGITQMWSLATEAAFYVILPILCALLLGRNRRFSLARILVWLAVISVLGVIWQCQAARIPGSEGHFAQWLPGYLPWFCAGIAVAAVGVADLQRPGRRHVLDRLAADPAGCWLIAALLYGLCCTPLVGARTLDAPTGWEAGTKVVLYTLSASFLLLPLVFGSQDEGWIRRICTHPVPRFLGEISYGIFCFHVLVLKAVFRTLDLGIFQGRFPEVFTLTVAISILLATAAHYAVERPLLSLKNVGPLGREATTAKTSAQTSNH
jgi:peptidoglycan/LPS O-acetylase OafA/YrhL